MRLLQLIQVTAFRFRVWRNTARAAYQAFRMMRAMGKVKVISSIKADTYSAKNSDTIRIQLIYAQI